MPPPPEVTPAELERASAAAGRLLEDLASSFVGQRPLVELSLAALLARGHLLLEGAPGLGKTWLVRSLARLLALDFGRVQCTPDLMPADITGGEVLAPDGGFRFVPGPVFCQVLLADEINRATPRTQAALLEAMEEGQVTAGLESHPLPRPFFVAATQNPIELEGTWSLPEAQLDRFLFKLIVRQPGLEELDEILAGPPRPRPEGTGLEAGEVLALQEAAAAVVVAEPLRRRVAEIVRATHPGNPEAPAAVRAGVRYGVSPRGGLAVLAGGRALALLRGRTHASPEDLRDALIPALRHRLLLAYEAEAAGERPEDLLREVLRGLPLE